METITKTKIKTAKQAPDFNPVGAGDVSAPSGVHLRIAAPNMKTAKFSVTGTAPMVVHRFSHKVKQQMIDKMIEGTRHGTTGKKTRPAVSLDELYNDARYISAEGWDGFNVSAVRASLISACRLVGFKMTLAKLSLFVIADGRDAKEPEIGLIRIYGKPRRLETRANVETGQPYVTVRPCYDEWKAELKIRFDADQFSVADVANLLARVGEQVGWCEGRPDSKNSAGMGWGTFRVDSKEQI